MSTQHPSAVSLNGPDVYDGRVNVAEFERFLDWLGPDPESAGKKYELIRGRLIMMFRARRCLFAEDLADTTFERVARKLADLTAEFTGDPARYFYGVAKKVYLEYQHELMTRYRQTQWSSPQSIADEDLENLLEQLDDALSALPKSDRELILTYYTESGRNKINHRRDLARQLGLRPNALRLRVFRIRRVLKNYLLGASTACMSAQPIASQLPFAGRVNETSLADYGSKLFA